LTSFTTLDEETLEKTKNNKMLSRLVKKGGEEVKTLAQKVLDNAVAATRAKAGSAKPKSDSVAPSMPQKAKPAEEKASGGKMSDGKPAGALPPKRASQVVAGAKRPLEAEGSDLPAQKRTVVPSGAKSAQLDASKARPVVKKGAPGNAEPKSASSSNNTASTSVKPKVNTVAAKPASQNLFASLSSASKKPGTSNAALAAAAKQKARYVNSGLFRHVV